MDEAGAMSNMKPNSFMSLSPHQQKKETEELSTNNGIVLVTYVARDFSSQEVFINRFQSQFFR